MHKLIYASLVWLFVASPALVFAHEGHDHGAPQPRLTVSAAPRGEASSDAFELVAVFRGGSLIVSLDRFATNEPVVDARLEGETRDGPVTLSAGPDGFYRVEAPWAATPGRKDLIFTVTLGDVVDILPVTVEVPAPAPAASPPPTVAGFLISPAIAQGIRDRLTAADPAVLGAAAGGFALGVTLMMLMRRRGKPVAIAALALAFAWGQSTPTSAHEGHDHGPAAATSTAGAGSVRDLAQRQPDGSIFVPKATQRILAIRAVLTEPTRQHRTAELPGRIIPDPSASGYVQVATGGRLSPPPGGFPRLGAQVREGQVLGYVTAPLQAMDRSDMRQRQGELDQQIGLVERRIARFEQLVRSGAGTQVQLDEARLELRGLRDRRAALDQARREPEPLIAPVSGLIAEASAVVGQMVQANTVIFHIVDPRRLWVEALSYDVITPGAGASGRTSAGRELSLAYQGSGLADRNQSIPVHFEITGDASGHRLGQFVTVIAPTSEEVEGVAVPRAAVVRAANGQDVVYLHTAAERFEPREVRTAPLDGHRVLVLAGLQRGQRLVTQGAELLDQVR
jgi:RND family efflux transporter MFP subunit